MVTSKPNFAKKRNIVGLSVLKVGNKIYNILFKPAKIRCKYFSQIKKVIFFIGLSTENMQPSMPYKYATLLLYTIWRTYEILNIILLLPFRESWIVYILFDYLITEYFVYNFSYITKTTNHFYIQKRSLGNYYHNISPHYWKDIFNIIMSPLHCNQLYIIIFLFSWHWGQ